MAENQKSSEFLSKLALIADAGQTLMKGKLTLVFELQDDEFKTALSVFEPGDLTDKNQFKVEISGTDFIFILDN